MPTVLITGANRGIGLQLTKDYLADGWRVHACCRAPEKATALKALTGDLHLHRLDVANETEIDGLAKSLAGVGLDVAINNAGVSGADDSSDPAGWLQVLRVNSIAPLRVAEALKPNLEKAKGRLANITSRMGSIGDNSSGGSYAYRSSKAALNAAMKSLAIDWHGNGVTVALFHPGWVRTDMGGPDALIDTATSAAGLRKKIAALTATDSGAFFNYDGKPIQW